MSFSIFIPPAPQRTYFGKYLHEFKQIWVVLNQNPNSKVLWTVHPEVARKLAISLNLRSKLRITRDNKSNGTILRLKEKN